MSIVQAMMGVVAQAPAGASNGLLNNLVRCYEMDSDATDETGNANGTATNVPRDTSDYVVGTAAADFDGSSSKIAATRISVSGNKFSLACRGKFTLSGTRCNIISQRDGGSNNDFQRYNAASGSTVGRLLLRGTSTANYDSSSGFYVNNTWTHYGVTWDGTNVKFYKNGSLFSTASGAQTASNLGSTNIEIGTDHFSGFLSGSIDQFLIYDTDLTAGNFSDLYNGGAGLPYSSFTS